MQRTGAPFLSFSFATATSNTSRSRPVTSTGGPSPEPLSSPSKVLHKGNRRPSIGAKSRKSSLPVSTSLAVSPSNRRRAYSLAASASASTSINATTSAHGNDRPWAHAIGLRIITNDVVPPLPALSLATASADGFSKMTPVNGGFSAGSQPAPPVNLQSGANNESSAVYQLIQETASKRISTLDYLRKAHEGPVYWFNTLLFDKPDLLRMLYFENRRLARRATNYLFLGLSLPTVIDRNSATPLEFLRSLNLLLSEYDSFQQLHSETGSASGSLSRARLPQMFRRSTAGSKTRRTADGVYGPDGFVESEGGMAGGAVVGISAAVATSAPSSVANYAATSSSSGPGAGGPSSSSLAVSLSSSEGADLLPGEEYAHLLTPSLPFDPDFFETFATLCDVLIDTYQRLLGLLPTPRECSTAVVELFTKADAKLRKIIVQGVVKDLEDATRAGIKTEVANVAKVVLGGLM